MQRRITGLTATAVALGMTATLAGCGSSGDDGEVTLKLVAADYGDSSANSSQKYWDDLVADFEAKDPGFKVDVDVYSWSDVDAKVAEMVKNDKAPDLAQIGAYADYAAQDKLYPADDLLSIRTQSNFLPQLTDAGEYRRSQYGMPFGSSTRLLFFNKDLFKKAGISDAPESWTELADDAELLKSQGGAKYPFALPLGREEAQAEAMIWMLAGGGGYTDSSGTYQINSNENIKTFEWLRDDLVGAGLTGPVAPGKLDRQDAFDAFAKGEVGMLSGHPALIKQATAAGLNFGTAPMPGINGNAKGTLGVADWMMAFKQNGHQKEIGTFLDFVYEEKNVVKWSERYGIPPVTIAAADAISADPRQKHLKDFLDELPTSEFYPVGETSWARVNAEVKKQIGKAVEKGGNPRSVLTELQNDAVAAQSEEE
ncbi:extracellular solute-binding protein [Streptomyces sp. T-3]|nr:extracellular solute-binding protein [Streptomyces sp. T-3]